MEDVMQFVMVPVPEDYVPEVRAFLAQLADREIGRGPQPTPTQLPEWFDRATAWVEKIIRNTSPEGYERSTPHANVTVRALLSRLINDTRQVAATIRGEKFGVDLPDATSDDLTVSYLAAAAALRTAMADTTNLGRKVLTPMGEIPARLLARSALADQLIIGREVALATGQDATIPADLIEAAGAALVLLRAQTHLTPRLDSRAPGASP